MLFRIMNLKSLSQKKFTMAGTNFFLHDKWKLHVKKYLVGFLDAMASDGTSIWKSTFGYIQN